MLHTIEEYKTALYKSAEHAENWHKKAKSLCENHYRCPETGYQWPANTFALSLGYTTEGRFGHEEEYEIVIDPILSITDELGLTDVVEEYLKDSVLGLITTITSHLAGDYTYLCNTKEGGLKVSKVIREFADNLK